jgi:hypothetical protein
VAPSLILNGFSKAVKAGVPGVELCAQVLRGMFPPVDINTFNVKQCRRVVLFHLEDETDSTEDATSSAASKKQESNSKSSNSKSSKTSSNQLIYFRQYAVEVADAGLSKNVKRMVGKDQINSRLMQKLEAGKEAADLVLDEGADSESEAEEDAVITTKNKQKRGEEDERLKKWYSTLTYLLIAAFTIEIQQYDSYYFVTLMGKSYGCRWSNHTYVS